MRASMRRAVILLLVMAFPLAVALPPVRAGKRAWTVIAGGETKQSAIVSNFFHPREIDITVGDTVTWKFVLNHTVAFLSGQPRPANLVREGDKFYRNIDVFFPVGNNTYDGTGYRNSGSPAGDPNFTYSLTFTKPGTYEYICLLHFPAMQGRVHVGERAFNSHEATDRRARMEQAATLRAGETAWATWEPDRKGQTVTVPLVDDMKAGFSILRFTKEPLVVAPGTTVTWVNRDSSRPHTVTLLGGEPAPPEIIVEAQPSGAPKFLVNPKWDTPTRITSYEGGFATSGRLFPTSAPPETPKVFSLTFTKPGQYEYVCMIHDAAGMRGTVIVR